MPSCPSIAGLDCPISGCLGLVNPQICEHIRGLAELRSLPRADQSARLEAGRPPSIDPRVRDAVNTCPSRGPVLTISQQADCGCRGKELSECRSGKGAIPGRVTLRECLACKAQG